MRYDFANLLFAGPCNARCPFCIGRQIDPRLSVNNLREFPPRNLDRFVDRDFQGCDVGDMEFVDRNPQHIPVDHGQRFSHRIHYRADFRFLTVRLPEQFIDFFHHRVEAFG